MNPAATFCATCGSRLTNGVCPTCPVAMYQPAQPSAPAYAPYPPAAAGFVSGAPGARYIGMWNWGAFLLCPLWLMNHRKVGLGILYIVLSVIPIVNLATLVMLIYFGVKGNEVAVASGRFTDDAQFVAVQNAWRNWGIGITIVCFVLFFFAGVVGALSGTR